MTATTTRPTLQSPAPPEAPESRYDTVVLDGVSWETYEKLRSDLDEAGEHAHIVYDDGRMTIIAPLSSHDRRKRLIGRMVEMLTFELDIPIASVGSASWKRKDLRKGLEPDEGYYIQHARQIGGRMDLELPQDPPPDLVLEVEGTRSPKPKFPVYAALGVPEIWHYEGKAIRCLHLRGGKYEPAETSLAFPFLRPADFQQFLEMLPARDENSMLRAFLDWLRSLRPTQ